MKYSLTVLAKGAATGVFLVRAESHECDDKGTPLFTVYFLSWKGKACSSALHSTLLKAANELVELEDAAEMDHDDQASDADESVSIKTDGQQPETPGNDVPRSLHEAWTRLPTVKWAEVDENSVPIRAVCELLSQNVGDALAALEIENAERRLLEDEHLSEHAVIVTSRKNGQDVVDTIRGVRPFIVASKGPH